jgi:hypothetical protein
LFSKEEMCFTLTHKIYFARVIMAYYHECVFIGYSEEEVINDILVELKKETKNNYE